MATLKVYDFKKNTTESIEVSSGLFDVEVNQGLLHMVVNAHLSNKRAGTACTKTRTEVAGSGKKPWKQKGTGRARSGSAQSPLWRGGGVAFGPKPRDFFMKINKKVKKLALRMAISSKKDAILVFKSFEVTAAKTKEAVLMLNKAEISHSLIVMNDISVNMSRATHNIPGIKVVKSSEVNVYDILRYTNLCIDSDALSLMEKELQK